MLTRWLRAIAAQLPMVMFGWGYLGIHVIWWLAPRTAVLITLGSLVPAALVSIVVGHRRSMVVAMAFAWIAYGFYPLHLVGLPYEAIAVSAALLVGGAVVVYGRAELLASAGAPYEDPISKFLGDEDD